MSDPRKARIYLAGKIAPNGWRDRLLNGRCGYAESGARSAVNAKGAPLPFRDPRHAVDIGPFVYVGPFFEDCNHQGSHGPATHGDCDLVGFGGVETRGQNKTRQLVFDRNMGAIERADVVFGYINEVDCFGTLVELGSAHALAKPIFVCFGPDLRAGEKRELWFAQQTATRLLEPPVEMAFRELVFNLKTLGQFRGRA